jgi:hypothetical protein
MSKEAREAIKKDRTTLAQIRARIDGVFKEYPVPGPAELSVLAGAAEAVARASGVVDDRERILDRDPRPPGINSATALSERGKSRR